jgi:deoxyribonuclease IV
MLEFGAHMSIAGGCDQALIKASALQMTSCQIFTKNANQWAAKPLDPAMIERWNEQRASTGVKHLVAHDSYLINIASPDEAAREKSRLALAVELERCDQLEIPYLVSHPGAHMGDGVDVGIQRVGESINRIFAEQPGGKSMLLLETTAGQGTTLGRSFEEIAAMIDQVENKSRVGVCLDTCHIFVAGYDIRDAESYKSTMDAFDSIVGLDNLKVIHLNDAQKGLGSHRDRHTHIGDGELGLSSFENLIGDERMCGRPAVLETPKGDNDEEDARNLATLRGIAERMAATKAVNA